MSDKQFRGNRTNDLVTPTTSMASTRSSTKVTNRSKRCTRRLQWCNDDKICKSQKYGDGAVTEQTSARPTIHRSMASTDLTSNLIFSIYFYVGLENFTFSSTEKHERFSIVLVPIYSVTLLRLEKKFELIYSITR